MSLAQQQRALLQLINGKSVKNSEGDQYLEEMAESPYLELAQEVVQWWKSYRIERFCPLTSELLKQLNRFDEETSQFEPHQVNIHYIENIGMAFLAHMTDHESPLISSVSQFEYALIKVKMGDDTDYIIHWSQDPTPVINALISLTSLPPEEQGENYKIHVSRSLPETFRIVA